MIPLQRSMLQPKPRVVTANWAPFIHESWRRPQPTGVIEMNSAAALPAAVGDHCKTPLLEGAGWGEGETQFESRPLNPSIAGQPKVTQWSSSGVS